MISGTDVNKIDDDFRLKHFKVSHKNSTMKVGTDAFIIGSWLKIDSGCRRILDVGTGCGIIALMLAQRSSARIDAIDIDQPSVEEAKSNFKNSHWSNRLNTIHASVTDFYPDEKYDLIVSNPPFFSKSLLPVSEKLQRAKHAVTISLDDFVKKSKTLLHCGGKLAVILPVDVSEMFTKTAIDFGFHTHELLKIIPKEGKPANRLVLVLSLTGCLFPDEDTLVIRDKNGKYTADYKELTADFHAEGYI